MKRITIPGCSKYTIAAIALSAAFATAACGSSSKPTSAGAPGTAATSPPAATQTPGPVATTTPAKQQLTSCQLLTQAEVEKALGTTVTAPRMDNTLGECRYDAPDAASGGLNFSVSLESRNGMLFYNQLKGSYAPTSGTLAPGEYVPLTGVGQGAFFAIDLGGAWTAAAISGDTSVSVQVGGTQYQGQHDISQVQSAMRGLLDTALSRALSGTPAK